VQEAPTDYPIVRPHVTEVAIVRQAADALEIESHRVEISEGVKPMSIAGGPAPVLVFPNHGDHTYAKIMLDPVSLDFAKHRLDEIVDPLLRQQLWTALWDMVRDQRFSSIGYLQLVEDKLATEANLHIIKVVTSTATAAISRYVPATHRVAETGRFVAAGRRALEAAPPGDPRVLWLRAMLRVAETPEDLAMVSGVIDGGDIEGLAIDQDMRWALAIRSSAAGLDDAAERAERELARDPSDRGRQSVLSVQTAVPLEATKEEAWARIHGDGYGSLHLDRAAMAGFNWASQAGLLDPYVGLFFDDLEGIFETREHEAAKAYFSGLAPRYRVDKEAIGRARVLLDHVDGPPQLERLLIELVDRQERALAVRRFADS